MEPINTDHKRVVTRHLISDTGDFYLGLTEIYCYLPNGGWSWSMETTKDDQIIYAPRAEPEDLVEELQKMGFIEKEAVGETAAAT
ncbi:uncharacterized protein FTJAE_3586 [Fusarium tjaetaba]|uniref:Uncharacterized protein n=1 Tax=Fusarium tjaetaba TaxID=1567544 RepID=A0A8H5RYS4_9HYPO|nr:uncharacterized protein FTJAE_3586 [Fusarium tjaetaba]KAF5642429.1 hypothetical protein FTJAE_3586 [Fusarium tjaetaba]